MHPAAMGPPPRVPYPSRAALPYPTSAATTCAIDGATASGR